MIRISVFRWVPPHVQGLVRDLRVRWALEEAGLAYEERLIGHDEKGTAEYRALQPFGQVPAYEEDGLTLFESGAIVLHVAERSGRLLPTDASARARAMCWFFAAINSVEPALQNLAAIDLFNADEEWGRLRRPAALELAERRLDTLAEQLQERDYLGSGFTAADLMMATVLRIVRHTDLVAARPALAAYHARCEERPAFRKALAEQMAVFARNAPAAA
jgi:glutathione S-transferase